VLNKNDAIKNNKKTAMLITINLFAMFSVLNLYSTFCPCIG